MPTFEQLTTPRALSTTRFVHEVADGWQQGRGAFGGLVLATITRAAQAHVGNTAVLRTLTAELCGPVLPGEVQIDVEPLRLGSGTSTIAARLTQHGELLTHAVLVFGKARQGDVQLIAPAPSMPPWQELPIVPSQGMPAFAAHFEYRNTGPLWFAGGQAARTEGWLRAHEPGAARDAAFVVGMADVWWPALFSWLTAPRPMATLTFTLDLVNTCEGLATGEPLFHQAHTLAAHDGWCPEQRMLWGADGRLLAVNHQTFVVIR